MRCNDHVCHQSVVFSAQYSGVWAGAKWAHHPLLVGTSDCYYHDALETLRWSQQPIGRQIKLKINQWYALIIVNPWILGGLARWSYVRLADTSWSVMLTLDTDNLLIKPDINLFHDSLPRRHHRWRFDKRFFLSHFDLFMTVPWLALCRIDGSWLVLTTLSLPAIHFILHLLKTL